MVPAVHANASGTGNPYFVMFAVILSMPDTKSFPYPAWMNTSAAAIRTTVIPHPGSSPKIPRMTVSSSRAPLIRAYTARQARSASLAPHAASCRPPRAGPASLSHLLHRHHRRSVRHLDADRHAIVARAPAHQLPAPARADRNAAVRPDAAADAP